MKVETRTFYSSKYNKTFVYKKTSENKRVLYELSKPVPRWDENPDDPKFQKPKLFKVQEKEYGDHWIKRKTNYQINPYYMPLKRTSRVPRMDKIKPYSGALFEIRESGGIREADFIMEGTISKQGHITNIGRMRNGFTEHIWWDKNDVRKSKITPNVFNLDEAKNKGVSNLAKRFMKKLAYTVLTNIK